MYTLILIAVLSNKAVSVVVPNLSYQECANQIRTISINMTVTSASCALQSTEGSK